MPEASVPAAAGSVALVPAAPAGVLDALVVPDWPLAMSCVRNCCADCCCVACDWKSPEVDPTIPPKELQFDFYVYICGLNFMVSSVREMLAGYGWHRKQIVFERYD